MPRDTKRKFTARLARRTRLTFRRAAEILASLAKEVEVSTQADGTATIPGIGSIRYSLVTPKSIKDKAEAEDFMNKHPGTCKPVLKVSKLKVGFAREFRSRLENIVDAKTFMVGPKLVDRLRSEADQLDSPEGIDSDADQI